MIFVAIAHLCVYKRLANQYLIVNALELKSKLSTDSDLTAHRWCDQNRSPLGVLRSCGLITEVKIQETFYRHTGEEWGFELTSTGLNLIAHNSGDDALRDAVTQHLWPRVASASVDWNALAGGIRGWSTWRG